VGAKQAVAASNEFAHFHVHEAFEDLAGRKRSFVSDLYFNGIGSMRYS
jgi:hypothetical protein